VLKFNLIPWWGAIIVAVCMGFLVAVIVQVFVVPRQRAQITGRYSKVAINIIIVPGIIGYTVDISGMFRVAIINL